MEIALDNTLIAKFKRTLISDPPRGRQKEQVVQDFLEKHSEMMPTLNLLNHGLHFELVVSKFPLCTALKVDYLYITKSSDHWEITLVEIEKPEKQIFNSNTKKTIPSAEFNGALSQIRSWKVFIDENKCEVIRKLEPLLKPLKMSQNPTEFRYMLIIGRSQNKNLSTDRMKHFRKIINEGVEIITYDQLIGFYRNGWGFKKNVLHLSGSTYKFKYMHIEPFDMLSFIGPSHLEFSSEQSERLIKLGYEIDKWKKGKLLICSGKYTTAKKAIENLKFPKLSKNRNGIRKNLVS